MNERASNDRMSRSRARPGARRAGRGARAVALGVVFASAFALLGAGPAGADERGARTRGSESREVTRAERRSGNEPVTTPVAEDPVVVVPVVEEPAVEETTADETTADETTAEETTAEETTAEAPVTAAAACDPYDPYSTCPDTDGDGTPDEFDADDDNDATGDLVDCYPLDASRQVCPITGTIGGTGGGTYGTGFLWYFGAPNPVAPPTTTLFTFVPVLPPVLIGLNAGACYGGYGLAVNQFGAVSTTLGNGC